MVHWDPVSFYLSSLVYLVDGPSDVLVGSFRFLGDDLFLSLGTRNSVGFGEANVGFPYSKWLEQTVLWSLATKPDRPFETFLVHCSLFSDCLGK